MTSSFLMNASIEGQAIDVKTRQFHRYPPKKNSVTKQVRYGFRTGIRSTAEIVKSHCDPVNDVVYASSMVNVGDFISGQTISGWSTKPLAEPYVSKGSASHSASFASIKASCYAVVELAPKEHLDDADFQARNPPVKQVLRVTNLAVQSS